MTLGFFTKDQTASDESGGSRLFSRRSAGICALLYLIAQVFFLVFIQFPKTQNFDEFHYVPSSKQFLEHKQNQNWEHPPLGKMIMAVGIAAWGDRPIGWRFMSTVFGALTLAGMYAWGMAVFRRRESALLVAMLTFFNQLLYVQSRIGMLDTFMFGFLVWGLAAFSASWDPALPSRTVRRLLALAGLFLGLATACKWFAIIPWAAILMMVVVIRILQFWGTRFADPRPDDWYQPGLWEGIRWWDWALWLVALPLLVYFVTFIPLLSTQPGGPSGAIAKLLWMQTEMFGGQLRVVNSHPYMSHWSQWPLMTRPIWYAFDKEGVDGKLARGVILLGNPLIMWGGLVALLACAWGWLARRNRDAFLIFGAWVVFYLSWVFIPRKIAFYYYYYPAGMSLSLAIAYVLDRVSRGSPERQHLAPWLRWGVVGCAAAIFFYFYPILSGLLIKSEEFRRWMWFSGWI